MSSRNERHRYYREKNNGVMFTSILHNVENIICNNYRMKNVFLEFFENVIYRSIFWVEADVWLPEVSDIEYRKSNDVNENTDKYNRSEDNMSNKSMDEKRIKDESEVESRKKSLELKYYKRRQIRGNRNSVKGVQLVNLKVR